MGRIKQSSSLKPWFFRSGWFFFFIGVGGLAYWYSMEQKDLSYQEMTSKLHQLEKEKAQALAERDELLLQIQSQSDPAWVEMILRRDLGMTGEGQVKVHFQAEE